MNRQLHLLSITDVRRTNAPLFTDHHAAGSARAPRTRLQGAKTNGVCVQTLALLFGKLCREKELASGCIIGTIRMVQLFRELHDLKLGKIEHFGAAAAVDTIGALVVVAPTLALVAVAVRKIKGVRPSTSCLPAPHCDTGADTDRASCLPFIR